MVKKQYACGTYRPEAKYHDKKRKSPPFSATDCVGHVLPGNDGNDWIAELSGKSVRWVKLDGKSKVKSVAKRSKQSRKYKGSKSFHVIKNKLKKTRSRKRSKNKIRKYRILSEEEIEEIKATVKTITIPAGTILYRTQDKRCNKDEGHLKDVHDKDTDRMGQYFSDGPIIPYGMIMEYNKPMYLCTFKVVEDIDILVGKYSFRKNDPENYYDTYEDYKKRKFIRNRLPREQTSSIDDGLYPLHDFFQEDEGDMLDLIKEHEIFLSSKDTNNWQKLQHLETTELITPEEAQNNIEVLLKLSCIVCNGIKYKHND